MRGIIQLQSLAILLVVAGAAAGGGPSLGGNILLDAVITLDLSASNSTTSASMVSFNFDWHTKDEEPPAWINMSAMILDLENPMLRSMARAMSPARLRIGGSEGDVVAYHVPSRNSTCESMGMKRSSPFCLSMGRFEELGNFAKELGLSLVFGLNAMAGREGGGAMKALDLTNIEALLTYAKEHGIPLYGVELGNELCKKISPSLYAADYRHLKSLLGNIWPQESEGERPLLIGNDCNIWPPGSKSERLGNDTTTKASYLEEWLPLLNDAVLDVITYHRYVGYGLDKNLETQIMTPEFLNKIMPQSVNMLREKYAPSAQIWVGEGAAAWHSGREGVTDRWTSSFWYADALGRLSQHNHSGYCRQTLVGGNYGLLDRTTFRPNPDFFVGLLFHKLMGNVVMKPAVAISSSSSSSSTDNAVLRVYAHCTRGQAGAVTLLVINIDPHTNFRLILNEENPSAKHVTGSLLYPRDEYVLSALSLEARDIEMNGSPLHVTTSADLPPLVPKTVFTNSELVVSPHTISFFDLKGVKSMACKGSFDDKPSVREKKT